MDRWGRRIVLMVGYSLGAIGCAIAGTAVSLGMLVPFVVGVVLFAGAGRNLRPHARRRRRALSAG